MADDSTMSDRRSPFAASTELSWVLQTDAPGNSTGHCQVATLPSKFCPCLAGGSPLIPDATCSLACEVPEGSLHAAVLQFLSGLCTRSVLGKRWSTGGPARSLAPPDSSRLTAGPDVLPTRLAGGRPPATGRDAPASFTHGSACLARRSCSTREWMSSDRGLACVLVCLPLSLFIPLNSFLPLRRPARGSSCLHTEYISEHRCVPGALLRAVRTGVDNMDKTKPPTRGAPILMGAVGQGPQRGRAGVQRTRALL